MSFIDFKKAFDNIVVHGSKSWKDSLVPDILCNVWYQRILISSVMLDFHNVFVKYISAMPMRLRLIFHNCCLQTTKWYFFR